MGLDDTLHFAKTGVLYQIRQGMRRYMMCHLGMEETWRIYFGGITEGSMVPHFAV